MNLNAPYVAIVRDIKSVGQAQDRGELYGPFLLIREKITQNFMRARGQRTAMKTGDDGSALQICGLPTERIAMPFYEIERSLVMALLAF